MARPATSGPAGAGSLGLYRANGECRERLTGYSVIVERGVRAGGTPFSLVLCRPSRLGELDERFASWLLASCLKAWFRPAGRVTFSKRPDGRPLKSNQKRFAPASGPALRSGFVTHFARPSGQPAAVTPLRSVSLRRRSEGRRTRAIHGPLRLSPRPCGSPLCATAPSPS